VGSAGSFKLQARSVNQITCTEFDLPGPSRSHRDVASISFIRPVGYGDWGRTPLAKPTKGRAKVEGSEWGSESRIAAIRRWHEKSVASRHDEILVLIEGADIQSGHRVLDVACGAGSPALEEARKVGPGGSVVGVDLSEAELSLAREFAQADRLSNVEFRIADAGALPFEDESFDRTTSGFGAMYFPDLARALAESRRVLRTGGQLAWMVWGPFEQPFWRATAGVAMRHAGISDLPPEAAKPFCFSAGGVLRRALETAGFESVRETTREIVSAWPGPPEEVAEMFYQGSPPFKGILDRLDPRSRKRAMAETAGTLGVYRSEGCIRVPRSMILATGVRSSKPLIKTSRTSRTPG